MSAADPDVFQLDPRLAHGSVVLGELALSRLLLVDDCRFGWLMLVPRRAGVRELIDLSAEDQVALVREIDTKTRSLQRDTEDAQTEFDQEQSKVLQELGQKMMAVIDKYARDNGFTLILDVGAPQNPVLYASNNIDITNEIVALYDKNAPTAAPAAAPAARPATPTRPATKK